MTSSCARCSNQMGEKCSQCESTVAPVPGSSRLYRCDQCHKCWRQGEDSDPTHGICQPCMARRLPLPVIAKGKRISD